MGKLSIWLHDNHLTEDPNDKYGKVNPAGVVDVEKIAEAIKAEGSELNTETLVDVVSRSLRIMSEKLADGYQINTPFCYARLGVSGRFDSATSRYDKEVHKITANFSMGTEVRKQLANAQVEILGLATVSPVIGTVTDTLTGEENSRITPGNVIRINGDRIKIAGDDATVGVWLVNQNDQSRTRCTQLIVNEPKELVVMIPANLSPGDYELEVVTQYTKGADPLKNARICSFEHMLNVD